MPPRADAHPGYNAFQQTFCFIDNSHLEPYDL